MAERPLTSGLRQRKKERLREELRRAATALFLARGVEATTVDDIVAKVDVSRRTFFRYFESKEDAWFGSPESYRERLERCIFEHPGGSPTALARHAYRNLVLECFEDVEQALAMAQLVQRSPTLHAKLTLFRDRNAKTISRALAKRLDLPPDDLYTTIIGLTTVCTIAAGVQRWLSENGARPLAHVIDEACASADAAFAGASPSN